MASLLSPEMIDNIFRYVNVSPQHLLIYRNWYLPIRRRLLQDIQLSTLALLRMPLLSDEYVELLCSCTRSINITLSISFIAEPWSTRFQSPTYENLVPYSDRWVYGVNVALVEMARRLPHFRALRSFIFCNFLDIDTSWSIINESTFESILSSLSNHCLDFVKLDMPGADLENRLQIYQPWVYMPHGCEMISKNFPQSRHLHLRMRRVCSKLLLFDYSCQPLLETLVIELNLDHNSSHELEQDSYVMDCRFSESFGLSLLKVLASAASKLSHSSNVPNLNTVRILCKNTGDQPKLSRSVPYTEAGAVWTVSRVHH